MFSTRSRLSRSLSALGLALILALPVSAAHAQDYSPTWYDQCGVIDTWYPQAGFGFDQRWHSEVYPVTIIETLSYVGPSYVYDICSQMVADGGGRYIEHDHGSRPWAYMRQVCVSYIDAATRVISYVPRPVDGAALQAYQDFCWNAGGNAV